MHALERPESSARTRRRLRRLASGALALAVAGLASGGPALADDPPPPAAPAPAAGSSFALGAQYFDQAVTYVARGGSIGRATDLYVHLDAKWDLDEKHDEGEQAVWFLAPDKMRSELTAAARTTTKILAGERAWVVLANGTTHRIHGTPGAEKDLKQMKEDLLRVRDLTDFVTLEGLKGPGVSFEFLGAVTGTKAYAGNWLKVLRRSPDDRRITFWLAHETDAAGQLKATWPGVVRVEGDAQAGLHTEDWILKDWDSASSKPRPFRYPFKIEAWQINPDPEAAKADPPKRFLTAFVDDIQLNAGIDSSRFQPPAAAPADPGGPK